MFEKIKVTALKLKTSELPSEKTQDYDLPALTAGIQNQGLNNFVPRKNATILKNVISISANGANTGATFYQSHDFTILQDAYAVKWKQNENLLTDNQYLFCVGTISKVIYGNYEWTNKAGWEKVKNENIQLPITSTGEIDFAFMENFISELEEERISELNAYLEVTGLKDYTLTPEEENALEDFSSLTWEEFKIDDLFYVNSSKKRFDANKVTLVKNGKPYVVRTAYNNGIKGFLDEDSKYLNNENTISFGQDTATMFYQEKPYFTGDKIKILEYRNEKFNKINAMFFLTTMSKSFSMFSWGSSSFSEEIIKSQYILLPSKNNEPDYSSMETFISAIQKLVIKDVVLYADKKINATKIITNNY